MIFKMDMVKRHELMDPLIKDYTQKEKNMEKGFIIGQMVPAMMVFGKKIKFVDLVHTLGLTAENIKENGKIIICMDLEFTHGMMEGNMKVRILMIRNMVMVFMYGQIKDNLKDNGKKEDNMGMENIKSLLQIKMELNLPISLPLNMDTGKMVND